MGSPRNEFRRNLDAEIVDRITSTDPVRRSFHMHKHEVEELGRGTGLPEEEARRTFFLLAGTVWVGELIGPATIHGYYAAAPMPEPDGWLGVAFDVTWFQGQGKAPTPLP